MFIYLFNLTNKHFSTEQDFYLFIKHLVTSVIDTFVKARF